MKRNQKLKFSRPHTTKPKLCQDHVASNNLKVNLNESCENLNLVECLKDIEQGRIQDFMVGNDKFKGQFYFPHVLYCPMLILHQNYGSGPLPMFQNIKIKAS